MGSRVVQQEWRCLMIRQFAADLLELAAEALRPPVPTQAQEEERARLVDAAEKWRKQVIDLIAQLARERECGDVRVGKLALELASEKARADAAEKALKTQSWLAESYTRKHESLWLALCDAVGAPADNAAQETGPELVLELIAQCDRARERADAAEAGARGLGALVNDLERQLRNALPYGVEEDAPLSDMVSILRVSVDESGKECEQKKARIAELEQQLKAERDGFSERELCAACGCDRNAHRAPDMGGCSSWFISEKGTFGDAELLNRIELLEQQLAQAWRPWPPPREPERMVECRHVQPLKCKGSASHLDDPSHVEYRELNQNEKEQAGG